MLISDQLLATTTVVYRMPMVAGLAVHFDERVNVVDETNLFDRQAVLSIPMHVIVCVLNLDVAVV